MGYHRTMKATLLLLCVLIVYLDCTQDTKAKKPKKMCKKPKGKPGTVIFKGCLKYQCIKKKNKYFWKKTIAEENCCVFNNNGFPVGSTILSEKSSEDGFSTASVKCELIGGMPEPVIDIENVCPVCTTPNGEVPVEMTTTTTPPITGRQIICKYQPKTDVMEHWEIDLDQRDFEYFLGQNDFTSAKDVYGKGANSMKTSDITLASGLAQSFPQGASVQQGSSAAGALNEKAESGDTTIKVGIFPPCISEFGQFPDTSGCFTTAGGSFEIDGTDVGSGIVNLKYRTIEKFSTEADAKMSNKTMFKKYKSYYGAGDYADKFITAALDGVNEGGTNVPMDFSAKDDDFKAESARCGSKLWSIWMYAIWEMEDAIDDCNDNCVPSEAETCNDAPVHAWDEAWAFYTGSREGKYGSDEGILLYRLAEDMCQEFDTCSAGKSIVNKVLIEYFIDGKAQIDAGNCNAAKAYRTNITTAMSIPLIQSTLKNAYDISQGTPSSKDLAMAAAFAGSIVPQIANCSAADAQTVMNNMWIDRTSTDFSSVKQAIENNYACLGVTCADIGGFSGSPAC